MAEAKAALVLIDRLTGPEESGAAFMLFPIACDGTEIRDAPPMPKNHGRPAHKGS
jgi:hypothetical protein